MSWLEKLGYKHSDDSLNVYITPDAFCKMARLVGSCPVEIGWNMTVKPYKDGYLIDGLYVYPQFVSAGYIEVNVSKWGMWKANLPDEVESNLFGHGHSHVMMETLPSPVDFRQQIEEVSMKKHGFYLFVIVNKKAERNWIFYDIDNKLVYKKIIMKIDGMKEFIEESKKMLENKNEPE